MADGNDVMGNELSASEQLLTFVSINLEAEVDVEGLSSASVGANVDPFTAVSLILDDANVCSSLHCDSRADLGVVGDADPAMLTDFKPDDVDGWSVSLSVSFEVELDVAASLAIVMSVFLSCSGH